MDFRRNVRRFLVPLALGMCFARTTAAQTSGGQVSGGQVSMDALTAACSSDAARLCSNVRTGGGRIVACLKQHQDQLSDACRKAGGLPPRANGVQLDGAQPSAAGTSTTQPNAAGTNAAGTGAAGPNAAGTGANYGARAQPGSGTNAIADYAVMPARAGTTPPAIGPPTTVAGEIFVRRPIVDAAHGNMMVATLHIPEKWSFDSAVAWHYDWIEDPLMVSAHATNPANAEAFSMYPILRFDSIEVAPQYRQAVRGPQTPAGQRTGSGAISMPVQQPLQTMILFIKQARPNMHIQWAGSQELPGLAQALNLSPWSGDHGLAIKITYDLNGQSVDEAFFGVYYVAQVGNAAVSAGQVRGAANGVRQTNWGMRGLMSFRAPTGTLERRMPVFALIAKSLAMNPQWVQMNKTINDQMLAAFNQKLQQGNDQIRASQAAAAQVMAQEKSFDKSVNTFDQGLRTTFDDSWLRTTGGGGNGSGGHLSSTDNASNILRGQATVQDSTSSTGTTQVSNAGDYHYTNGLGDYRTYSDPNMTPEKAGESGAWTPMTEVH